MFEVAIYARILVKTGPKHVMGPGLKTLLEHIQDSGSIAEAARRMGISYRKALRMTERLNEACGQEMIQTWKGGPNKGGASLSPQGEQLLLRYKTLTQRVADFLAKEAADFWTPQGFKAP